MSWIKDNKFMVSLGGGTLLGVILLYLVGSKGAGSYAGAKETFDAAVQDATGYERLALYPRNENKIGKSKALEEYRKSVEELQASFKPYRVAEMKNIRSQEFTNNLLAANTELRAAFEAGKTTVPDAFFVGFERYKASLANDRATGVLNYELDAIKKVLLELAKAKPTELRNLYRVPLPEEEGKAYTPGATDITRAYPLEISFVGPEESARNFLSAINKTENSFITVRVIRVTNAKKDPPRAADAKFEKPAEEKAVSSAASTGFVLPGEEAAPAEAAVPDAPKAADTSRILSQVLGSEQVQVFLRLDILEFLAEKKLP